MNMTGQNNRLATKFLWLHSRPITSIPLVKKNIHETAIVNALMMKKQHRNHRTTHLDLMKM